MDNMQVIPSSPGGGLLPLVTQLPGKTPGKSEAAPAAGLSFAELLGAVAIPEALPAADAVTGEGKERATVESATGENADQAEKGEETEVTLQVNGAVPLPQALPVAVQQPVIAALPVQIPTGAHGSEIHNLQEQASTATGKSLQAEMAGISPLPVVQEPTELLTPPQKGEVSGGTAGPLQEDNVIGAAASVILPLEGNGGMEKLPGNRQEKPAEAKNTSWVSSKPASDGTADKLPAGPGPETPLRAQVPTAGNAQPSPDSVAVFAPVAAPAAGAVGMAKVVPRADEEENKEMATATGDQGKKPEGEPAMATEPAREEAPRGRETMVRQRQDRMTHGGGRSAESAEGQQAGPGPEAKAIGAKEPSEMKTPIKAPYPDTGDIVAKPAAGEKGVGQHLQNFSAGEPLKMAPVEPSQKGEAAISASAEHILTQVKETLAQHNPREGRQITMTLNPAELGELKINVSMDGQRLRVEVTAENATVRDVLLANIDTLKESLSKQNVTMERFNVSTGGSYGFSHQSNEERWVPNNRSHRNYSAQGGVFAEGDERKVSYLTGTGQGLVDVRF